MHRAARTAATGACLPCGRPPSGLPRRRCPQKWKRNENGALFFDLEIRLSTATSIGGGKRKRKRRRQRRRPAAPASGRRHRVVGRVRRCELGVRPRGGTVAAAAASPPNVLEEGASWAEWPVVVSGGPGRPRLAQAAEVLAQVQEAQVVPPPNGNGVAPAVGAAPLVAPPERYRLGAVQRAQKLVGPLRDGQPVEVSIAGDHLAQRHGVRLAALPRLGRPDEPAAVARPRRRRRRRRR